MASSSSVIEPLVNKRKRGCTNEESYKCNLIRKARVKGGSYISYNGELVLPKSVPDKLFCECPSKCCLNISDETKNEVWNHFYALDSKNAQDTYLQTLIEVREIKRRRQKMSKKNKTGDSGSADSNQSPPSFKKNNSFVYYIKKKGILTAVCKNIFLQIHGVSRDRVKRLSNLLVQNKQPVDMRGKNQSGNAIPQDVCALIHDHISSFEVNETHYEGKPRKYLDAKLNISKMYDMFLSEYPHLWNTVKYNFYYLYFKKNFNFSFGCPDA